MSEARGADRRTPDEDQAATPARWSEPAHPWLPGAEDMPDHERSVLLEVVTRLLFPSVLVFSVYLLLSGHDHPGGGFPGGLVAGLAFVLRYLAGGRAVLATATPVPPEVLAGTGLALAAVVAIAPAAFGAEPLSSAVLTAHPPLLGEVEFATSLFFEIGIYVLVLGVVLKLLTAFGPRLDHEEPGDDTGSEGTR